MTPLSLSTRADLFHIARAFADPEQPAWEAVWTEPLRDGGIVHVAGDGLDFIAIPNPDGYASRNGALAIPSRLTKLGADLQRRNDKLTLLRTQNGLAWLDPDASQDLARNIDLDLKFCDWRRLFQKHAGVAFKPPFVGTAAMGRLISDAAYGLARAAGVSESGDLWELCGGLDGATVVKFTAWPDAVALFGATPERADLRGRGGSMWLPPRWMALTRLASVEPAGAK